MKRALDSKPKDAKPPPAAPAAKAAASAAAAKPQAPAVTTGVSEARKNALRKAAAPKERKKIVPVKKTKEYRSDEDRGLTAALGSNGASWGIDTMASAHLTGNKKALSDLRKCTPMQIEVADGGIVTATQVGDLELCVYIEEKDKVVRVPVRNVYYSERFAANLLSWHVLKELGWKFSSDKEETTVLTPGGNEVKLSTKQRVTVMHCRVPVEQANATRNAPSSKVQQIILLHERFNHMGFDNMVKMIKGGKTLNIGLACSERDFKEKPDNTC